MGFVSLTEALDLTTPAGRAMAGLLAVFAAFEREVRGERTRAVLARARQDGKRLGRPATAAVHAAEIRKLHRAGVSKSAIARRVQVGRTCVRRILASIGRRSHQSWWPLWWPFRISTLFGAIANYEPDSFRLPVSHS
ncbi:MAG: recombinase family protein [Candidatus Solibacter sp.]